MLNKEGGISLLHIFYFLLMKGLTDATTLFLIWKINYIYLKSDPSDPSFQPLHRVNWVMNFIWLEEISHKQLIEQFVNVCGSLFWSIQRDSPSKLSSILGLFLPRGHHVISQKISGLHWYNYFARAFILKQSQEGVEEPMWMKPD